MADFASALPFVLKHEGGWSNDANDPGGATNFGITLAVARRYGIGTAEDLRAITADKVAAIYRADYWRFDGINSHAVATKIFDMGVNMGVGMAVGLCQGALNAMGAKLVVDGRYGMATEDAINAVDPARLIPALCEASADHYADIVARRPESSKFLHGWLARAAEVPNGAMGPRSAE